MIRRCACVLILAIAACPSRATAQPAAGGQQPASSPLSNLQVLAKDTPPADVAEIMRNVAASLGVQCGYCHVQAAPAAGGRRGAPGGAQGGRGDGGAAAAFDYASDGKREKQAAREMMRMVRDLNLRVAAAVGKPAGTAADVGCITCHRGVPIPRQLPDILDETARLKGVPAALAQYRALRRQFFGAQAYDFSEASLVAYGRRALQDGRPDDAVAWLTLNLEYFPLSSRTHAALAQAYEQNRNLPAAIASLAKAAELDPKDAQLQRQLEQLKKK